MKTYKVLEPGFGPRGIFYSPEQRPTLVASDEEIKTFALDTASWLKPVVTTSPEKPKVKRKPKGKDFIETDKTPEDGFIETDEDDVLDDDQSVDSVESL